MAEHDAPKAQEHEQAVLRGMPGVEDANASQPETIELPGDGADNKEQDAGEEERQAEEGDGDVPQKVASGEVEQADASLEARTMAAAAAGIIPTQLVPDLPPLPPNTHAPDSPTTELITTLRMQITLLTDQSTDLNTKLINQLSRVGDLEDSLEHARAATSERDRIVEELEAQKRQWEESMQTGLLVERGAVRDEMQRLVEGLVEEERRRGSAEEGRKRVEQEVDDLSVSLFEQANTMVAAERMQRHQAETRLRAAEENLSLAEAAVRSMQQHLQSLPSLLPAPELSTTARTQRRYLAGTPPHSEYLSFLGHLRLLKPQHASSSMLPPPLVSALQAQPFLTRITTEDHDPTLRLDAAPDLNWLSRRSLNAAILSGDLSIEPVSVGTLLASSTYATHSGEIGCSMCGKPVLSTLGRSNAPTPPPSHPATGPSRSASGASSVGINSRFSLKPFFSPTAVHAPRTSSSPGPFGGASVSPLASPSLNGPSKSSLPPIYVFRIGTSSSSSSSSSSATDKESRPYPLCHTGWCLARLRATCEVWRFVRSGIVDVVWKGEDGYVAPTGRVGTDRKSMPALPVRSIQPSSSATSTMSRDSAASVTTTSADDGSVDNKPELPPRKRSGWGLGFKFGGGSRASVDAAAAVDGDVDGTSRRGSRVTSGTDGEVHKVVVPEGQNVVTEALDEDKTVDKQDKTEHAPQQATADAPQLADEAPTSGAPELQPPSADADADHTAAVAPSTGAEQVTTPSVTGSDADVEFSTPKVSPQTTGTAEAHGTKVEGNDVQEDEGKVDSADNATEDESAQVRDQPDEQPAEDSEQIGAGDQPIDLSSPHGSEGAISTPTTPVVPPPVPRRAPGRPTSVQVPAAQVRALVAETEQEETREDAPREEEMPRTPDPNADSYDDDVNTPVAAVATPPALPARPRLPPRSHGRTTSNVTTVPGSRGPSGVSTSSAAVTGKEKPQYIEGDGWEAKTWKEVIRLKEEMWMARVGVVARKDDDDEDE